MNKQKKPEAAVAAVIPKDSSEVLQRLIPRVLRATFEEDGADVHDRANACLFAMCSHLANIEDTAVREAFIDALSDTAVSLINMNREQLQKLDAFAAERGLTQQEMFAEAAKRGEGEPLPEAPSEH